jgi:hypothetical protein
MRQVNLRLLASGNTGFPLPNLLSTTISLGADQRSRPPGQHERFFFGKGRRLFRPTAGTERAQPRTQGLNDPPLSCTRPLWILISRTADLNISRLPPVHACRAARDLRAAVRLAGRHLQAARRADGRRGLMFGLWRCAPRGVDVTPCRHRH